MTQPTPSSKEGFLRAYRTELVRGYAGWTADEAKLERFMTSARITIYGTVGRGTWSHNGPAALAAWRAIGGKGRVGLAILRALPDNNEEEG